VKKVIKDGVRCHHTVQLLYRRLLSECLAVQTGHPRLSFDAIGTSKGQKYSREELLMRNIVLWPLHIEVRAVDKLYPLRNFFKEAKRINPGHIETDKSSASSMHMNDNG